ncbi:hypothetical protein [Phenylobacterium sp.]|uniref:hypothetical protein n=1 Tax=Phenylobacterium sp. TaxID=1871053 RepID=UPI0025EA097F|nr:hypothetical protein [Phenylobacterium sp.]
MKLRVVIAAALIAAAGPAMAETGSRCNFATGCPQGMAKPKSYGLPGSTPAPAYRGPTTAPMYGAPEPPKPEAFKPYQPYKPASVFGPEPKKKR